LDTEVDQRQIARMVRFFELQPNYIFTVSLEQKGFANSCHWR